MTHTSWLISRTDFRLRCAPYLQCSWLCIHKAALMLPSCQSRSEGTTAKETTRQRRVLSLLQLPVRKYKISLAIKRCIAVFNNTDKSNKSDKLFCKQKRKAHITSTLDWYYCFNKVVCSPIFIIKLCHQFVDNTQLFQFVISNNCLQTNKQTHKQEHCD